MSYATVTIRRGQVSIQPESIPGAHRRNIFAGVQPVMWPEAWAAPIVQRGRPVTGMNPRVTLEIAAMERNTGGAALEPT